jgi:DNA replicative helicase MCM subunit Mcm2 (Cdc46/Mcm family)
MAKAISCLIDVKLAIQLRKERGPKFAKANFSCKKCGRPVKPTVENSTGVAHFEHYQRNIDCSLSDKRPIRRAYAASKV